MKAKYLGINWRSFLSVYMTISFIVMTLTGIILYIAPPGRVAHWSNWTLWGLLKEEWQAVHTIFTFIFIAAGILHLIFNWKPLLSYLRKKADVSVRIKKETVLALFFSFFVFAGTLMALPPFGTVMDVGEYFTESWSNDEVEPPVPHVERMTVAEFAETIKMDLNDLKSRLRINGINVNDHSMTLQEIADSHSISPSHIFSLVQTEKRVGDTDHLPQMGSGFGRKMLSEVFKEYSLTWEAGVSLLKESNITVEDDVKIKDLASENSLLPVDLVKIIGRLN